MYVIAEIGSNYNSIEDCIISIELAKKAGADAVKFQHFTLEEMYGQGKGETTPETWLYGLKKVADQMQLDFSCTFFEPNKLRRYTEMLDFIKIASSNMLDIRLLEVAKHTGKKTYISTGGHELHEVQRVYDYFPAASYMYCESVYPSRVNDYDKMQRFFFEGISDHSTEVYPSYPMGTKVVEKHVNLVEVSGKPDCPHSLCFNEFRRFCGHVKKTDKFKPLLSIEEVDMRLRYNVRLVAKKNIGQGVQFNWDNIGVYRGTEHKQGYVNPMDHDKVIGKYAKDDIKAWSTLTFDNVQASQPEAKSMRTF